MGYQEFKLELPQLSRMKLKVLFLLHFVLISWATLGEWAGMVSWIFTPLPSHEFFSPQAFVLHNLLFLGCLVWSIALPHSEDAIFLTLIINCVSVLLDIIILAIHYPNEILDSSTAEFSAVMAIFNLLLRFVTAYVAHTEWSERCGGLAALPSTVPKSAAPTEGGSVRSGSVLTHYPG